MSWSAVKTCGLGLSSPFQKYRVGLPVMVDTARVASLPSHTVGLLSESAISIGSCTYTPVVAPVSGHSAVVTLILYSTSPFRCGVVSRVVPFSPGICTKSPFPSDSYHVMPSWLPSITAVMLMLSPWQMSSIAGSVIFTGSCTVMEAVTGSDLQKSFSAKTSTVMSWSAVKTCGLGPSSPFQKYRVGSPVITVAASSASAPLQTVRLSVCKPISIGLWTVIFTSSVSPAQDWL